MSKLEKRFRVVQDANGDWGVLDTVEKEGNYGAQAFAPWRDWNKGGEDWYSFWSDAVTWAITLNQAASLSDRRAEEERYCLAWDPYEAREENK